MTRSKDIQQLSIERLENDYKSQWDCFATLYFEIIKIKRQKGEGTRIFSRNKGNFLFLFPFSDRPQNDYNDEKRLKNR